MSWIKDALSISQLDNDDYYIVTDPIQFYEWKWTGVVSKGTKVSKLLPPSEVFTNGFIVINAPIPKDAIQNGKLSCDVNTSVQMKIGQIQSPAELLDRYIAMDKEFKKGIDDFKKNCLSQKYIISHGKDPHLYKVSAIDDTSVMVSNFGPLDDLGKQIEEFRRMTNYLSHQKIGRAYEWEDARKIDNIVTFMSNKGLEIDGAKFDVLISKSGLKPLSSNKESWIDCYCTMHPEATETKGKMAKFRSLYWVRGMF